MRKTPFAMAAVHVPEGSVPAFSRRALPVTDAADGSGPLRALSGGARPLSEICDNLRYGGAAPSGALLLLARTRAQLRAWDVDDETAHNTGFVVSELTTPP
ncbi:hypothetical protein ACFZAU_21375 [Streptomyces sp. NPDC008238]